MGARYAQHFLINQHGIARIVEALRLQPSDVVLEIGPGRGALTQLLLRQAKNVLAVEVDSRMTEVLAQKFASQSNLVLIHDDILSIDLSALKEKYSRADPLKIVGNLPYNLTSPILRRLADWPGWSEACVMVQKEVGERLCAAVATPAYGALSVGVSLTAVVEPVFVLSETSFDPRPKVKSMVVKLIRRDTPLTTHLKTAQRVIQAAFQQRRKTLLNSLSHNLNLSKAEVTIWLTGLNISPQIRPERVSVADFVRLAESFDQKKESSPT